MRLTWWRSLDITFDIRHHSNSNSRNHPEGKAFAPCDELLYASLWYRSKPNIVLSSSIHRSVTQVTVQLRRYWCKAWRQDAVKDRIATPHKQSLFLALERSHEYLSKIFQCFQKYRTKSATTGCRIIRVSDMNPNGFGIPERKSNNAGTLPRPRNKRKQKSVGRKANVMCYLGHQDNRTALFWCGVRRCKGSEPSTLFEQEIFPPPPHSIYSLLDFSMEPHVCISYSGHWRIQSMHLGNYCLSLTHRHHLSGWPCSQALTFDWFLIL